MLLWLCGYVEKIEGFFVPQLLAAMLAGSKNYHLLEYVETFLCASIAGAELSVAGVCRGFFCASIARAKLSFAGHVCMDMCGHVLSRFEMDMCVWDMCLLRPFCAFFLFEFPSIAGMLIHFHSGEFWHSLGVQN